MTDLHGRSPVDAFVASDVDYAPISEYDASWIAYDHQLGRELRRVPALSVSYLGFDTTRVLHHTIPYRGDPHRLYTVVAERARGAAEDDGSSVPRG